MTEHAAPLTVIQANGRTFIAVGDLVSLMRAMADDVDGGAQRASQVLRHLADTLAAAAGSDELFHAPPTVPPAPCPSCGARTHTCDRLGGGTIVLSADATPYGGWIILVGGDGRQVATRYDVAKHSRVKCSRYREHACAGLS